MSLRTSISRNSEFREKQVNNVLKTDYALSQVKFYSHWNYRNLYKLNVRPIVIINIKLPGISSMCYGIIINQFKLKKNEKLSLLFTPNKNCYGIALCTLRFAKRKSKNN